MQSTLVKAAALTLSLIATAASAEGVRTEKNISLDLANQIAAHTVAACTASSGVIPARTRRANSWALSPCAETPVSVPKAIRTPPACARRAMSSILGPASSAFAVSVTTRRAWRTCSTPETNGNIRRNVP